MQIGLALDAFRPPEMLGLLNEFDEGDACLRSRFLLREDHGGTLGLGTLDELKNHLFASMEKPKGEGRRRVKLSFAFLPALHWLTNIPPTFSPPHQCLLMSEHC